MPKGFQKGRHIGRAKGTPNKLTRAVREAIERAFEKVGGDDYLVTVAKEQPQVFCTLLGKLLPMQLSGGDGPPIRTETRDGHPIDADGAV